MRERETGVRHTLSVTTLIKKGHIPVTTHYLHLTPDGRVEIEKRLDRHESLRTIAAALGRAASTIAREVRRGRWRASNENAAYAPYRDVALHASELTAAQYRAGRAQNTADTRAARSHQPTRLVTDQAITHLVSKLRDGWTPEMIVKMGDKADCAIHFHY